MLRSFIAIELSETLKNELARLQQELKKCGADVRWVKPENIHLTLKFLGDIEEQIVEDVVKIIQGTCSTFKPFSLDIKGTGLFPNPRSPRALWVGVNGSEDVIRFQGEINDRMSALGFKREKRRFTPHLTLGRFKSPQDKDPLLEKIVLLKNRSLGRMNVLTISLMQSELSPAGAQYRRLADIPLGPGS